MLCYALYKSAEGPQGGISRRKTSPHPPYENRNQNMQSKSQTQASRPKLKATAQPALHINLNLRRASSSSVTEVLSSLSSPVLLPSLPALRHGIGSRSPILDILDSRNTGGGLSLEGLPPWLMGSRAEGAVCPKRKHVGAPRHS